MNNILSDNFFSSNEDLQYYFSKGVDWSSIIKLTENNFQLEGGFKDSQEALVFYQNILNQVGKFSALELAPCARIIDLESKKLFGGSIIDGSEFEKLCARIGSLRLHGMCLPRELRGLNAPLLIHHINTELLTRGDAGVMAHHRSHDGIAVALLIYSIWEGSTTFQVQPLRILKTRFGNALSAIISGKAWGSLSITEPDGGSDMAAFQTRARLTPEGQWTVTGKKIFVSSGHGKYHMVIARSDSSEEQAPQNVEVSLFLVEAYEEFHDTPRVWHAEITHCEEKLGQHGSATVSVVYRNTPAELIGKRGEGFRLIELFMNNACISASFASLGLCEAAYQMASSYAPKQPSIGKIIAHHELIASYLDDMQTGIKAIRALAFECAFHEEMGQKLKIQRLTGVLNAAEEDLAARRQRHHETIAKKLTPLLKYQAAEAAVSIARFNVQIHGEFGYTKACNAERLLRDALAFPVYEGTSQSQAIKATKDALYTAIKDPARFTHKLAKVKAQSLSVLHPLSRRVHQLEALTLSSIGYLIGQLAHGTFQRSKGLYWASLKKAFLKDWDLHVDLAPALRHAERLTQLLFIQETSKILLKQAKAHGEREDLLLRFLESYEPKAQMLSREITSTGRRILSKSKDEFSAEVPPMPVDAMFHTLTPHAELNL